MKLVHSALAILLGASTAAQATGYLETPVAGSVQTGISIISGWYCNASVIQVSIDGAYVGNAGYGTPRADTASMCGSANTKSGFSYLLNYNTLTAGTHSVVVSADGVAFGNATFTTVNLGAEYLAGAAGRYALRNFPGIGTQSTLTWDESRQNFSLTGSKQMGPAIYEGPRIAGRYYGATGGQYDHCDLPSAPLTDPKYGRFDVSLQGNQIRVDFNFVDGTSCFLVGAATLNPDGFASVNQPAGSCAIDASAILKVDGLRLRGQFGDHDCYHFSFFGAKATFVDE
jgi:hypothetical protein